jgi:hypothetical protein
MPTNEEHRQDKCCSLRDGVHDTFCLNHNEMHYRRCFNCGEPEWQAAMKCGLCRKCQPSQEIPISPYLQ